MTLKVQATVKVEVELVEGPYGPDWSLEAIYKDAKLRALEKLQCRHSELRILSQPQVTAILLPEKLT